MKRDLYGSAISAGVVTRRGDGSVHYDTNITVKLSNDNGVTPAGSHGRYAIFSDTRTRPLVGNTGDYTLSLIRASITTNEIPLYVAKPSALVTENGTKMWEVTMQPGLSMVWTGPVYTPTAAGLADSVDRTYAGWPDRGLIPFTVTSVAGVTTGIIDCSSVGASPDTLLATVVSRLNTLFTNANVNITVAAPTDTTTSQVYTFTSTNANETTVLDFSLGSTAAFLGKAGILQACKVLGFIPGQAFTILPSAAVTLPRTYQKAFRTTLDLYSYKTARWVPEDTNAPLPTEADVANGNTGSYFDCYDYAHVASLVVNPTFQRCIWDNYDSGVVLAEQCLIKQLLSCVGTNVIATVPWSSGTSYTAGQQVVSGGHAWIALTANTGIPPTNVPGSSSVTWLDCGQAINRTYVDGFKYLTGDVVTFQNPSGAVFFCAANRTTTDVPVASAGTANGWVSTAAWTYGTLAVSSPIVTTAAPTVAYNQSLQVFTLNLDSYGFGSTLAQNVDDGYPGNSINDAPYRLGQKTTSLTVQQEILNSSLNDIARDSWGLTGLTAAISPAPYTVARSRGPSASFDERCNVEVDDYFHQLFGNWQSLRLTYTDPRSLLTTAYVRYVPQASTASLTVATTLPQSPTAPVSTGLAANYLPYGRVASSVQYNYVFNQDYPSIGLAWNAFDAIIVATGNVPIEDDQVNPPYILDDNGAPSTQQTNGNTIKILAELNLKPLSTGYVGQEFRNEIVFDPVFPVVMELQTGRVFNQFDYQLFLREKATQRYRKLSLSNFGNANIRFVLNRKV
jgi:hypothetical protein